MNKKEVFLALALISIIFFTFSLPEISALCSTDCQAVGYGGGTCVSDTITTGYTDPYCTGGSAPNCRFNIFHYPVSYCGPTAECVCYDIEPCSACPAGSPGTYLDFCNDDVGCNSAPDTTPPTVTIQSPTSNPTYTTTVSPISLSGTASDNVILSSMSWVNTRIEGYVGGSGIPAGTSSWNIDYINLEPGQNAIIVSAKDEIGNKGSDILTITYNPPATSSYPIISLTEGAVGYSISISDPDTLDVSYAYAPKPNIYFLVPFANDDNPVLSSVEESRYNTIANNLASEWDSLTFNRHPVNFYFMEPFQIPNYASTEDSRFYYTTRAIDKFNTDHPGLLSYPAIYVFLYPEPYFSYTETSQFGSTSKQILAEVYYSYFHDLSGKSDEVIHNIILHELVHDFAGLPDKIPSNNNSLFWIGHPASFYVDTVCSSRYGCNPYVPSDSPTGTEGYYEAYSVMSPARSNLEKANMQNRDLELSPVIEMGMGIRSKYDDENYIYYGGYISGGSFHPTGVYDYGISSRNILDYSEEDNKPGLYWDIRFDSPKTNLGNTKSFSVSKSSQNGKSLIIFASDSQNPGYFKVFVNNARSETISFLNPLGTCSQGQITSACLCGGVAYASGYCCSGAWQSSSCTVAPPICSEGQITSTCLCGGTSYASGYCCSGTWQSSSCTGGGGGGGGGGTTPTCSQGQITSTCLCGGISYSSGYCCLGLWQSITCPTAYTVLKTSNPLLIDGNLDEFTEANEINLISQFGATGHYKFLWDSSYLYVAAEIYDSNLNANLSHQEDGNLYEDDSIEMIFDTLSNKGPIQDDDYKFFVNVNDVHTDTQRYNSGWDSGMYSIVNIGTGTINNNADTDIKYVIEARIPWANWATPVNDGIWGMNLALNDKPDETTYPAQTLWSGSSINNLDDAGSVLFSSQTVTSPATSLCNSGADLNFDDFVSIIELINHIGKWKVGEVTITNLIQAIGEWKAGCG